MKLLKNELMDYYRANSFYKHGNRTDYNPFESEMNAYAESHPDASALELKTAQYEIIAENFTPVIFRNTPFFSELGVKMSEYSGRATGAGGWLYRRNHHLYRDADPVAYDHYIFASLHGIHLAYGPYCDPDHHCFPFTAVVKNGLEYYYHIYDGVEQNEFTRCVKRSLLAVKKIAEKFASAADALQSSNEAECKNLSLISATARRIPWKKPESFYEGLCTMWFLHEVCASIDGVGMSVIGRPDYTLEKLYENDIKSGRISYDSAYDLICRFMLHTDCKLDLEKPVREQFNISEQGDTLILGGCDESGREVCNDLTFLFLRAHRELKLIYPKIHCRISKNSSSEFLKSANQDFMNGRNTISFLNDDLLIPAQVKAGKSIEDARCYVAGGCWEVIIEGCEHSQGANNYFNLARIMDFSIHESTQVELDTGEHFTKIDGAKDFESVYSIIIDNVIRSIKNMCNCISMGERQWEKVNPAPFFSACLNGCLESRSDYSAGGARYNPHGIPLAGLAILVDSLNAIKHLCFDEKTSTLAELLHAVRSNWDGYEILRLAALSAPRFGDGKGGEKLAAGVLNDICVALRPLCNGHGGVFQPGLYNYRDIIDWAKITRSTPDGRKNGDLLTQGLTPSRYSKGLNIGDIFSSCESLALIDFPANSLLTLSFQRKGMTPEILAVLEKASPVGMLQVNCIDREELLDARLHPERHQDLLVRLYGYSARFIMLDNEMQEEFISRIIL